MYEKKAINPTSIPWYGYILPDDQGTSWLVLEMIIRNGFGIGEQENQLETKFVRWRLKCNVWNRNNMKVWVLKYSTYLKRMNTHWIQICLNTYQHAVNIGDHICLADIVVADIYLHCEWYLFVNGWVAIYVQTYQMWKENHFFRTNLFTSFSSGRFIFTLVSSPSDLSGLTNSQYLNPKPLQTL